MSHLSGNENQNLGQLLPLFGKKCLNYNFEIFGFENLEEKNFYLGRKRLERAYSF